MTDAQLWTKLKDGDHDALKKIYTNHIDRLTGYGLRFTNDVATVEDAIHDLFVTIWEKRDTIGNTDSIAGYLMLSLRRSLIKGVKKKSSTETALEPDTIQFDCEIAIDEVMMREEESDEKHVRLKKAFEKISKRQKEAIYLKYHQGMPYEEICEIMEINYQSVRNLISKGILALKDHIFWFLMIFSS